MIPNTLLFANMNRYFSLLNQLGPVPSIGLPYGGTANNPTIYFVDSVSGSNNNGGLTSDTAFATLGAAVSAAVADHGDIIMVSDKHAETLTAALSISKAGLTIIGMGNGNSRPTITVGAAIDGITVSGADCYIGNIRFPIATVASTTSKINVTAARCEIDNCEFIGGGNDSVMIILGAGSTGAYVHDCEFVITASGPTIGVSMPSATTSTRIRLENFVSHASSTANAWSTALISSTVAITDLQIREIRNDFGPTVNLTSATSTGLMYNVWPGELGTAGFQVKSGGLTLRGGPAQGYLVRIADAALPQSGNGTLITATNGRIKLNSVVGQVGTVVQTQACNSKLIAHPATGTDVDLCAVVDITAIEAGGFITPSNTGLVATALIKAAAGGILGAAKWGAILGSGVVLRFNTAASNTGTIKWDIYWEQCDNVGYGV